MAARHRRTHVTIALLVALVLVTALTAACSAQATGGALAASGTSGDGASTASRLSGRERRIRRGRQGRRQRRLGAHRRRARLDAGRHADQAGRRPARRLRGPRVHDQRRQLAQADRLGRRPGDAGLEHGLAQPHHGAEPRHREGAAQGHPRRRLRRHQPRLVHLDAEVGHRLPAVSGRRPATRSPCSSRTSTASRRPGSSRPARSRRWSSSGSASGTRSTRRTSAATRRLLEDLIQLCQTRGLQAGAVRAAEEHAGHRQLPQRADDQVPRKCAALAAKYGVPWVSFVSAARLPNSDFYDIWHLVEPGRTIWQKLLSAQGTAALLKQYGYDGGS